VKPADFGDIGQGVQGLVTALGVIAAGIWAVFVFKDLGSEQQARSALTAAQNQAAVAQQQLERQPKIEFALSPKLHGGAGGEYLDLMVNVKNVGTRVAGVDNLVVGLFRLGPDGHLDAKTPPMGLAQQLIGPDLQLQDMNQTRFIHPDQSRDMAFPFPALRPGRYFLQLNCTYSGYDDQNGRLQRSSDLSIGAIEQTIVEVR
jgi:hypothetical protein